MHAELNCRELAAYLAKKNPPITKPAVPVTSVYVGFINNAVPTVITGSVTIVGDDILMDQLWKNPAGGSMSPNLFLNFDPHQGNRIPWKVSAYAGVAPGVHQMTVNISQIVFGDQHRNGLLGTIVFTVLVLDTAKPQVEDLEKPPSHEGVLTFLKVGKDDSVSLE